MMACLQSDSDAVLPIGSECGSKSSPHGAEDRLGDAGYLGRSRHSPQLWRKRVRGGPAPAGKRWSTSELPILGAPLCAAFPVSVVDSCDMTCNFAAMRPSESGQVPGRWLSTRTCREMGRLGACLRPHPPLPQGAAAHARLNCAEGALRLCLRGFTAPHRSNAKRVTS